MYPYILTKTFIWIYIFLQVWIQFDFSYVQLGIWFMWPLWVCVVVMSKLNWTCNTFDFNYNDGEIFNLFFPDKEFAAVKERQEIELAAQRATLQEQRTHIDILDTALTNAQSNVVRLEEEVNTVL